MRQTVEFSSADFLLLGERAATDRPAPLVVAFSASVATGVKDAPCFSARTLRAVQAHQLHVMACRRHAWQTPEMARVFATVQAYAAAVSAREILAIGTSIGGFGALLFAPEIAASRVLAFSPQCTVDLRKLRFDPRWNWPVYGEDALNLQALVDAHGSLPYDDMAASLAAPIARVILFDSETPDAAHARRLRGPGTSLYPLPHASHAVSRFLKQTDCFEPLLAAFTEGNLQAIPGILARARRQRWDSPLYCNHFVADQKYAVRHPKRYVRALRAQIERQPTNIFLRRKLVEHFLVRGDAQMAMEAALAARQSMPDEPGAALLVAQATSAVSGAAGQH